MINIKIEGNNIYTIAEKKLSKEDYEILIPEELQSVTKIVTKGAFHIYSSMQNIETDDIQ